MNLCAHPMEVEVELRTRLLNVKGIFDTRILFEWNMCRFSIWITKIEIFLDFECCWDNRQCVNVTKCIVSKHSNFASISNSGHFQMPKCYKYCLFFIRTKIIMLHSLFIQSIVFRVLLQVFCWGCLRMAVNRYAISFYFADS